MAEVIYPQRITLSGPINTASGKLEKGATLINPIETPFTIRYTLEASTQEYPANTVIFLKDGTPIQNLLSSQTHESKQ